MNKKRVGFIGFGKRVENVYMPIFKKTSSIFDISGFSTRRDERADYVSNKFGIKRYTSQQNLSSESDLIIAFTPPENQFEVLDKVSKFADNILIETPVLDNRVLSIQNANICVSEQWPFLPLEQFKRLYVDKGIVDIPFYAHNDCRSFDYHAIAQLRSYIGRDLAPISAYGNGIGIRSPRYIDKNGNEKSNENEFWDIGQVKFNNGAVISHSFSYACKISPFRSLQTLRFYSRNGTIISGKKDDKENDYEIVDVRYVNSDGTTTYCKIDVKRDGDTTLEISDSASGVTWINPYGNMGLTDQETAICTLVSSIAAGNVEYSPRDSLIDSFIMNAIKQSCSTSKVINFG
tara:strand:+ start:388 stop:1428 length:1041 start_codon:yes stop_codon:yes gene_type:complete